MISESNEARFTLSEEVRIPDLEGLPSQMVIEEIHKIEKTRSFFLKILQILKLLEQVEVERSVKERGSSEDNMGKRVPLESA
jgi:hypothetical protein